MPYTKFKADSPRAIAGLKFQTETLNKLSEQYPNVKFEMVWDYHKRKNPELTDRELAIIEKREGDITYVVNGQRHYIECCFAMGKKLSRLCEMKRISFVGDNKWYCYGFATSDDIVFIPSTTWKSYTSKIKKADRSCRMIPISSIFNLKAGKKGITNYWEAYHGCTA